MNVPDLSLPFELAPPDFDPVLVLTVLLGYCLGALTAVVLLTLRPFARHRTSPVEASLALATLIACCLGLGAFADRSQGSLVAAALAATAGALSYWAVYRRAGGTGDRGAAGLLPDTELRRDKTRSDRWVLVTGPDSSGKTELVETMIAAAPVRQVGMVRRAEDGKSRATEVAIRGYRGGTGTLRVWESPSIAESGGRLPPLDDFDAVVLTVDPVQHAPIADSFPSALRPARTPTDANDTVLQLAEALPGGRPVWAVATKADLLRFSVFPGLLNLPIRVGPGWYEQVRSMNVLERRHLADTLGLGQLTREHQPGFQWGTESPLFAYRGASGSQRPFGAPELMSAILDTLWPAP